MSRVHDALRRAEQSGSLTPPAPRPNPIGSGVGIGATVVNVMKGGGNWSYLWVPVVGPLLGAVVGSFIWSAQEGNAD